MDTTYILISRCSLRHTAASSFILQSKCLNSFFYLLLSTVFLFNRTTKCSVFNSQETLTTSQPVIFNPDFFVERLRHEHPQIFADLLLSNISRLIDLPGDEFAQLTGEAEPRVPSSSGFLRSFNFLKRKG